MLAGAILAFARALGEFGATIIVAGSIPGVTRTLAVGIYSHAETGQDAQALTLVLVSVTIAFVSLWLANRLVERGARVIALDIELAQGPFTLAAAVQLEARAAALFGPSGAGKTTILDAIAGLRTPRRGSIVIDDRVLFSTDVARQPAGAQAARWLRAAGRRALPAHERARQPALRPASRRCRRISIAWSGCSRSTPLLDRRVTDLSGGERQRVAVGRALMSGPSLLLLDEPLAAVDVPLRRRILPYLRRVRDELKVPIVYVSHDREEIDELADVVVTLEQGRVSWRRRKVA